MTNRGFSLSELLVAMAIVSIMLVAMLGLVISGQDMAQRNESVAKLQNNVRFAMDRLERDMRMIGFGVPTGAQIGGSGNWLPSIFHASSTAIGFRADADGGRASIVCTPNSSNANCPLDELYLDSVAYYDSLDCYRPDDPSTRLPVVVVHDGDAWQRSTCSGVDTTDGFLGVSDVQSGTFVAGRSAVLTVEQVYYRYTAANQPPYGRLERYVRYANTPDNTFPPTSISWVLIADHLTDFSLEYRNAAGSALTGSPLSAANRGLVRSIFILMEGFDDAGPHGTPRTFQAETQVLVRNPSADVQTAVDLL